jgi:hypothetical protein
MVDYIWVNKPEGLADDFSLIEEPEVWTLNWMIAKMQQTNNRFSFGLHASGKMATISYVNYVTNAKDQIKIQTVQTKEHGFLTAYLEERVTKDVVLSTEP